MDKKIAKPRWKQQLRPVVIGTLALGIVGVAYGFSQHSDTAQRQHVSAQGLQISTVSQGQFADTLAVRGQVMPKTTIYLDSIAGGVVEQRLAEHGDFVQKGQPLLRLSNTALQLEVMSREAQVTEQLNFLRNTQMTMETNRLNLKRDLLDVDLQIRQLTRRLQQSKQLQQHNLIAAETLAQLQDDLKFYQERRKLALEQQAQENSIRAQQLAQLEDSARMLQTNLQLARSNLDNLLVKAPATGYLSELNVEVGESKERGARLGQIDLPGEYKLVVQLDEFYLNQISRDMPVQLQLDQQAVEASISKVDSRVTNNQFSIEVALPASASTLRRGQSVDANIVLGASKADATLLPRGAFFASSGGNWVYVLSIDGDRAERRDIRLGKRNQQFFEVLDGLQPGERVITSGYGSFDKATVLSIE
jgi:HlyD family secretion protein